MKRAGVTLAEIILAIGLLSVAVLGLLGVFVSQMALSGKSSQMSTADRLGHSLLEKSRRRGYNEISAGSFSGSLPDPVSASGFPPWPYPKQTVNNRAFVLNVTAALVQPGLMGIQVDVHWDGGKTSLKTYVHP